MQHPHEPDGLIKSYLPVNIGCEKRYGTGGHLLVRIDPPLFDELARKPWITYSSGRTYRQQVNPDASHEADRLVRDTIHLARLVSGHPNAQPLNGDWLDMRRDNLFVPTTAWPIQTGVKPGTTLIADPDFREAGLRRLVTIEWLNKYVIERTRKKKLTQDQVRAFLDNVINAPWLKDATLELLAEDLLDEYKIRFNVNEVSRILRGKLYPVPGYNYDKVAAARPTRGRLNTLRAEDKKIFGA